MKKILKRLLILIAILNFMGMMIQCTIVDNNDTTIVSDSIEKDRLQMIKEKGVLTIVAPPKELPFFYIDPKTKERSGIDADIITEIAKRLGVNKVEVKEASFANLFGELNADNSIDMAVGGIFITPKGKELVAFTEPLYRETDIVIVPQFSNINFMDDLKNTVVGVERGTIFVDLAEKWKENNLIKDIVIYESTYDLLNAINYKKVDAGVADSIVVNSVLSKDNKLPLRTLKGYTPELHGTLGMAVRKEDSSLLEPLNKIINEMKADGTLYAIFVENGLDKNNMV